ncbi:MAG TPA: D-aminoacylase [Vicinamibacterales bacterium]|nr:D-aminoacylase [Vicinamibacterales bacterium]
MTGLRVLAASVGLAVAFVSGCDAPAPTFDLIVRGGRVFDGTGADATRSDVGIRGDRIVALGDLSRESAGREINATGLAVSPGFIDVQGQSGTTLLADGHGESHLRQGITTEIIGEGSSPAFWTSKTADAEGLRPFGITFDWTGFDGYFQKLQQQGIALNLGTLIPATAVRREIIGLDNRDPSPEELSRMEAMVDQAMRDGALGLSSALIYPPGSFAKTSELVALAKIAARHRGIYVSHVRGESFNLLAALDEAIQIGREGGLPVVIFHLKVAARQNWGRMGDVIAKLNGATLSGVRVQATMYPYTAGGTGLAATLPLWVQEGGREKMLARLKDPAIRSRAQREIEGTIDGWENLVLASGFEGIQIASVPASADQSLVGKRLSEIAAARNQSPLQTLFDILAETDGRAGALYHMMSEDDVKNGLRWGGTSIGSDSSAVRPDGPLGRGAPHPRAYGSFPRVLGKYVREDQVLTLPDAIRRMTSLPAAQFGIQGRGTIQQGVIADLVIFDPTTVRDTATYQAPHQYPEGIRHVIVNGVPVLDPQGLSGARPGRAVYGRGRTVPGPPS